VSRIPCRHLIFALTLPFTIPVASAAPTQLVTQSPQTVTEVAPGVFLVDFGRVAFGNLRLLPPAGATSAVTVHFGEALKAGRIDRQPGGTIRYARATATLAGAAPLVVAPPADARNTKPPSAILTPADWGVVLPFCWVEIEGWPGSLQATQVERRAAFARTWQDDAAAFRCDDATLNGIWELCRYSIKATTYAGVYVDGDRERIPYEADAYLNQLSHYACDPDPTMARDTFDRLLQFPTWPTEWAAHVIFMAQADWMQTGDTAWLAARYDALHAKLLLDRARPDGLLVSTPAQIKQGDIVDWPVGERDGFVIYDQPALRKCIDLFRKVAPTLVFTTAPRDYMVDHEMASLLARSSSFVYAVPNISTLPIKEGSRVPYLYYCDPLDGVDPLGNPVTPTTLIDISAQLEKKAAMLACHVSQREWLRAHHGTDEYLDAMRRHAAHP